MERFSAIIGTGSYVPENVITNFDLEKMVDTTNEWILRRTGMVERRVADQNTASSDLGIEASRKALKDAGVDPLDVELIIVATITPDMLFPATACYIQGGLEAKKAAAFDLSAACSGFSYALAVADSIIKSGIYKTVLVVAAETLSKIVDWTDRRTCVLFGDAAGAAVLQATEEKRGILYSYLGSDGTYADPWLLGLPAGGSRYPVSHETIDKKMHYLQMSGQEVFKLGVTIMPDAALEALKGAQLSIEDVDLFIPHQANVRIIEAVGKRLGLPEDKIYINVHKYGNTSSATTIVALDEAIKEGRVSKGDIILLVSFGSGMTWAANVIKL
jgi:3-oxoacyl-[acyl-carrier-protein] synthase-3